MDCAICYAGDNKNVVTWANYRRPGSRVAKYFVRILNRLGNEYGFAVIPMYISTMNNNCKTNCPDWNMREQ